MEEEVEEIATKAEEVEEEYLNVDMPEDKVTL